MKKKESLLKKLTAYGAGFCMLSGFILSPGTYKSKTLDTTFIEAKAEELSNISKTSMEWIASYEAEDAVFLGGTRILESSEENKLVQDISIHENNGGGVEFTNVAVPRDGRYLLKVYYAASAADRYFNLSVDNQFEAKLYTYDTGTFYHDTITPYLADVYLTAGTHTLKIDSDWYAPFLDKIELYEMPYQTPQIYEAEDAAWQGPASIRESIHASGQRRVGGIGGGENSKKGELTFYVNVLESDTYLLKIFYTLAANDGSDRRHFDIRVNGIESEHSMYNISSWEEPVPYLIEVPLLSGLNEITVGCAENYAPDLDKIEVYADAFEAEYAVLTGGAFLQENQNASNGLQAGNLEQGGRLTFPDFSVKESGRYVLKLYYSSNVYDKYFNLSVNGETQKVNLGKTGDNQEIGYELVEVNLNTSGNIFSFYCDEYYAPSLDKIEVVGKLEGSSTSFEAENAVLQYHAQTSSSKDASGGIVVGSIETPGEWFLQSVRFENIYVEDAGHYYMKVYYASGSGDRYYDIFENTNSNTEVKNFYSSNDGDFSTIRTKIVRVHLDAGYNFIGFGSYWYAPLLDKIELYLNQEDLTNSISFEAEDAVLQNGASIIRKGNASNGSAVQNIGSEGGSHADGRVVFQNVSVDHEGSYKLILRYAGEASDRGFRISVNNGAMESLKCPGGSGGNDVFANVSMYITLHQGQNTIAIGEDKWYAPYLDKITLLLAEETIPEEEITFENRIMAEAETALLSGSAVANFHVPACSGSGKVNYIGEGASVTFDINAALEGIYALDISYVTADDREFEIDVNGSLQNILFYAGINWDIPNRHVLLVSLQEGYNQIRFSKETGYAPDLDKISIYPVQVLTDGALTVIYDMNGGVYTVIKDGRTLIQDAAASAKAGNTLYVSYEYEEHSLTQNEISDAHGTGTQYRITHTAAGKPTLLQEFNVYPENTYFTTKVSICSTNGRELASNYIAPLTVNQQGAIENTLTTEDYFLKTPFDNDMHVEFEPAGINTTGLSHEVTAIYHQENETADGRGIILGSLTHDLWKTGIRFAGSNNQINQLELFGGVVSELTRDQSPHGELTGMTVSSPVMFIGCYDNWQDGMNAFARANTVYAPKKTNFNSVPMGWNSWGVAMQNISHEIAIGASDYIKQNLQDIWKTEDEDVVYINLDSYANNLTREELEDFVAHVKANGQKPGYYWTPFAIWNDRNSQHEIYVPGTNYTYYDIVLRKADGTPYGDELDGGYPMDVTHPAALQMFDKEIAFFKELGFEYMKLDFLGHGALEGSFHDLSIARTGIEAYNFAMNYIEEQLGDTMFLNLSIAPTFPYQYANGKRIGCDAFYDIGDTEYTLNSLTYGFWEKELYAYPDPDHLVIWGKEGSAYETEARSRVTSGILLGTSFLSGDNLYAPFGNASAANQRFQSLLGNREIIKAAKTGKIFKPYSLSFGSRSSDTFIMQDGNTYYIAVMNFYKNTSKTKNIDVSGIIGSSSYTIKELWSGQNIRVTDGKIPVTLNSRDSKVYQLELR